MRLKLAAATCWSLLRCLIVHRQGRWCAVCQNADFIRQLAAITGAVEVR